MLKKTHRYMYPDCVCHLYTKESTQTKRIHPAVKVNNSRVRYNFQIFTLPHTHTRAHFVCVCG